MPESWLAPGWAGTPADLADALTYNANLTLPKITVAKSRLAPGWAGTLADLADALGGASGGGGARGPDPACYAEAARASARPLTPLPGALAALGQTLLLRGRLAAELRDSARRADAPRAGAGDRADRCGPAGPGVCSVAWRAHPISCLWSLAEKR